MKASFQIGMYDKDGDKFMDGIFLHLYRNMVDDYPLIIKVEKVEEVEELAAKLTAIANEIKSNY